VNVALFLKFTIPVTVMAFALRTRQTLATTNGASFYIASDLVQSPPLSSAIGTLIIAGATLPKSIKKLHAIQFARGHFPWQTWAWGGYWCATLPFSGNKSRLARVG